MAVGLRQVLEVGLAADDRDRGVGQAGEIAWQVAHIDAVAVFVVGEVADIVQAVLDVPVVADQVRQLLGSGPVGGQRGECVGHCGAGGPGLEDMPLAVDAAMPLVEGFARGGVGEVHALQVGQHGGLVVLDGGDHVLSARPEMATASAEMATDRAPPGSRWSCWQSRAVPAPGRCHARRPRPACGRSDQDADREGQSKANSPRSALQQHYESNPIHRISAESLALDLPARVE